MGSLGALYRNVAILLPYLPPSLVAILGLIATILEIALGIGLILGWKIRWVSLASGSLLTLFAVAMATSTGVKSVLDYSVPTAAFASFLLYYHPTIGAQKPSKDS